MERKQNRETDRVKQKIVNREREREREKDSKAVRGRRKEREGNIREQI